LHHDDHDVGGEEEVVKKEVVEEEEVDESQGRTDRRGSILSLWKTGKDKNGRAVMVHDDEEWKD
jgi:hypothetical protein